MPSTMELYWHQIQALLTTKGGVCVHERISIAASVVVLSHASSLKTAHQMMVELHEWQMTATTHCKNWHGGQGNGTGRRQRKPAVIQVMQKPQPSTNGRLLETPHAQEHREGKLSCRSCRWWHRPQR